MEVKRFVYLIAGNERGDEAERAGDPGSDLAGRQLEKPHGDHHVQARLHQRQQPVVRLLHLSQVLLVLQPHMTQRHC